MPRTVIKGDTRGNLLKGPARQGDTVVEVQVTHDSKVDIRGHEANIFKTATGGEELHKSTKVTGQGNLNPIGYIHSHSNTCFLVTRLDTARKTIQIDKQGKVKAGSHDF